MRFHCIAPRRDESEALHLCGPAFESPRARSFFSPLALRWVLAIGRFCSLKIWPDLFVFFVADSFHIFEVVSAFECPRIHVETSN
jgi:hypothetical protein